MDEGLLENRKSPERPGLDKVLSREYTIDGPDDRGKRPPSYPTRNKSVFLWIILILFIAFWTFVLGVFLGRGTLYQKQAIKELEKRLAIYTSKIIPDEGKQEAAPKTDPSPDTKPEPQHTEGKYSVQVAAFKSAHQADSLVIELREKGFSAYYYHHTTHKGHTFYPVRVGNYMTKEEARSAMKELSPMGFKGMYISELH